MRLVLLGSTGYIGENLLSMYPDALTPRVDIGDPVAVAAMLEEAKPDVLINAAGKTGRPNVDWCEMHKAETLHANVLGPLVLQEACAARGIYWVHMSSGCIYAGDNGGRGWTEEDLPNFAGSYYSRTKAWSEQMLKDLAEERGGILIVRPRMPFDGTSHPRNLLQKLIRYAKVLDEPNSLTYVPDMLAAMRQLIDKRTTGIFNMVNAGLLSPYQIMERYRDVVDPSHTFDRLTVETLAGAVATGRSNCRLSIDKLAHAGITMRPAAEALEEALEKLRRS
jgi:dTDP-4-dehydrorhamnose reductase